jgi:hypothetical protein
MRHALLDLLANDLLDLFFVHHAQGLLFFDAPEERGRAD